MLTNKPRLLKLSGNKLGNDGFTIVELLIATLIFSVVLLLITFGIIQIGRTFTRGVTESQTEDVARSIIDTMSQDIQYQSGQINAVTPLSNNYAICLGQHRYSVALGQMLVDSSTANHALIVDSPGTCDTATPDTSPSNNGTELLAPNMRLAVLTVNESIPFATNPNIKFYTIHVRVVYGPNDLMCSHNYDDCGNNTNNMPTYDLIPADLTCKIQSGEQFCGVADFVTTVQKRL